MSASSVTLAGQRAAEALMVDTCIVDRKTGTTTQSPTPPFDAVDDYSPPLYAGKCRVQRPGSSVGGGETVVGEAEFGVQTVHGQLPLSAVGLKRGDRFRVTALGPNSDPDLLNLTATVKANLTKTHPTKRTLVCEEVTSS